MSLWAWLLSGAAAWLVTDELLHILRDEMSWCRLLRLHYYASKVPGPPQHPIWGNLAIFRKESSHRVMQRLAKEYGPIFVVRYMHIVFLVITDPDVAATVLRNGPDGFPKNERAYRGIQQFTKPGLPNILTSKSTELWRTVRRTSASAFSTANLKVAFPQVRALTAQAVELLRTRGPDARTDMDELAQRLTFDVITQFGFGLDEAAGSLRHVPLLEALQHLLVASQERANPLNRWLPWREAYRSYELWRGEWTRGVRKVVTRVQAASPPAHTLAAHLLQARTPDGKPLSFDQLVAEFGVFLSAGYETTAHSLSWTLFLLATHPEAEARATAELDALGLLATAARPQARRLEWEDLAKLKYISAVISESLRVFPVVSSGVLRKAPRDTTLLGYKLPYGMGVVPHFYSLHHHPAVWPDPDAFKPERWLSRAAQPEADGVAASADDTNDSMSDKARGYLPFSEGSRNCVGQALAMLELRTAVAMLLAHFSFELAADMGGYDGVCASAFQSVTLRPRNGLYMHCLPRVPA